MPMGVLKWRPPHPFPEMFRKDQENPEDKDHEKQDPEKACPYP
jgi:hypothetical protein